MASAKSDVVTCESACIGDPSPANIEKARAARRALADAEQGRELARPSAERLESEVAAAERSRISAKLAEFTSSPLVDEQLTMLSVEVAACAVTLFQGMQASASRKRSQIVEANTLRARLGEKAEAVPSIDELTNATLKEIGDLGLATQGLLGVRVDQLGPYVAQLFPFWKEGRVSWLPKQYLRDHGYYVGRHAGEDEQARADRTLTTAAVALERLQFRRSTSEPSDRAAVISSTVAAVAVAAMSVLACFAMAGG